LKTFLAIFSCHKYNYNLCGMHDWFSRPVYDRLSGLRDSWLKDVDCDYKIFKGRGACQPAPDEIFLNVPDDYYHSYLKIRGIINYTLSHGYDRLLKIDDDVYAYWDRLMEEGLVGDYSGGGGPRFHGSVYCAGFTYWLSRHAMEILQGSPAGEWAEDRWVGETLFKRGIYCNFDDRYYVAPFTKTNQLITDEELYKPNAHLTIHSLSPNQMRWYYKFIHGGE